MDHRSTIVNRNRSADVIVGYANDAAGNGSPTLRSPPGRRAASCGNALQATPLALHQGREFGYAAVPRSPPVTPPRFQPRRVRLADEAVVRIWRPRRSSPRRSRCRTCGPAACSTASRPHASNAPSAVRSPTSKRAPEPELQLRTPPSLYGSGAATAHRTVDLARFLITAGPVPIAGDPSGRIVETEDVRTIRPRTPSRAPRIQSCSPRALAYVYRIYGGRSVST